MRILVTGGAGFIGSHLTRRLLADGHEVHVIDNESNGLRSTVPAGAHFVHGDVIRPEDLEPVFAKKLDAVCHLAGQVSIIRAFDNPVGDLRTNTEGTVNVVQQCVKHRVPRLIYASSMTAYGDCERVPTPESEPCKPDSYYGITKFAAERYVHATAVRPDLGFDFRVTSLRMFSVYGPGQALDNPYQGVLGIFTGRLIRGEPLIIFGDGKQTRDFVYIGDIFNAYLEREYFAETRQPPTLRERAESLARRLLGRPAGGYKILFLYPHQLHAWARDLGCRECFPLLEVDEVKPLLFRKYRFDALIRK